MIIGFSKLRKIFSSIEFLHHLRIQRPCYIFWFCNPFYALCMYILLTVFNTNFRTEKKLCPIAKKVSTCNTFVSNACCLCFCEYSMKEVFTNTRYYTPQTCHITGTFNLLCHIIPQFVPQLRLTMRQ